MRNKPGTHPTWKPETAVESWKTHDYFWAAKRRRRRILMGQIKKHGRFFYFKKPIIPDPMHHGPCVPTVVTFKDERGMFARLLGLNKGKRTRLVAGKGHRLVSFDKFGNHLWHPRYADLKVCLVCKQVVTRTHGTRPGA